MRIILQFLLKFHARLLRLYPKAFQEEFSDELRSVFNLALQDAGRIGKLEMARVLLRELAVLPQAILYEHLRERRKAKMTRELTSRFDFAPGSRKEILAAIAPFLLCGIVPLLVSLFITAPDTLEQMLGFCMLVSMASALAIGFFRHVPRWFMPYLGLPLPVLSALISINWMDRWYGSFPLNLPIPLFWWTFLSYGLIWGIFITLFVLLVIFSAVVPRYRPFYRRLRNDWTLLCFVLYGATPYVTIFCFEGYPNSGLFIELIFLIVATGGWLYLRNDVPWKKILILIAAETLSMFTAAVGQVVLYPGSAYYDPHTNINIVWWDYVHVSVALWLWLALMMFLPRAINLLPRSRQPLQTS